MDVQQSFEYCPRCGKQALSPAEDHSVLCSSCEFHFFFNVATAVSGIITNKQQEILFLERGRDPFKGYWDVPGGFMNPGETAEDTLRREVQEEVGVEIDAIQFYLTAPNRYTYKGLTYSISDIFYTATTTDNPSPQDDEVTSVAWTMAAEIDMERVAFESVRFALSQFQQQ